LGKKTNILVNKTSVLVNKTNICGQQNLIKKSVDRFVEKNVEAPAIADDMI